VSNLKFNYLAGFDHPSPTESCTDRYSSQFENNYFTEMCSGSEAGSYLRLIDFVYHSTLGLRVIKKKKSGRSSAGRVVLSAGG